MSIISNLVEKGIEKSRVKNKKIRKPKDVKMRDNLYNRIKKRMRLELGKCPYCGKRLIEGEIHNMYGGALNLIDDYLKLCPDMHYLKRYDSNNPQLGGVYENNDKVIDLSDTDWDLWLCGNIEV